MDTSQTHTVFASSRRIASGPLETVLPIAKAHADAHPDEQILFFDDESGRQREFDLSTPPEAAVAQADAQSSAKRRGRPRLGVECGEVCLLPRHWDWLAAQPRSASATMRRLIDAARKNESSHDRLRQRIVATDRFLYAIAGDAENYEEASRALYAEDFVRFRELTDPWPDDVRAHAQRLLEIPGANE